MTFAESDRGIIFQRAEKGDVGIGLDCSAQLGLMSFATGAVGDEMDLELGADVGETELDFSLGGTEVETLDESAMADAGDGRLDFDLGADFGAAEEDDDVSLGLGDAEVELQ